MTVKIARNETICKRLRRCIPAVLWPPKWGGAGALTAASGALRNPGKGPMDVSTYWLS